MTASGLHSQGTDPNVMWIPRQDALKKLAQAERAKYLEEKLAAKQADIDTLLARITVQQEIIKEQAQVIHADSMIINSKDQQISLMLDQRKFFELDVTAYKNLLKIERRKRRWLSFGSLAAVAGAFFIGTKF